MENLGSNKASWSEYALRIVTLIQHSDVRLPAGLPSSGKIVRKANVEPFLRRYSQMVECCGTKASKPRIAFHWTASENFASIADSNFRVPDGVGKNGAAFGHGIYVAPNFRDFREDFSKGTSVALMCLVLTGRQEVRRPRSEARCVLELSDEFDSIRGLLSNRPCETWVLPTADLVLPCFLVDELARKEAAETLNAVIELVCESCQFETTSHEAPAGTCSNRRWHRNKPSSEISAECLDQLAHDDLSHPDDFIVDCECDSVKLDMNGSQQRRRWHLRST